MNKTSMKKTLSVLLVLVVLCLLAVTSQAATLPESGKKIIEKRLKEEVGLAFSINKSCGEEGKCFYRSGPSTGLSTEDMFESASIIYKYMSSKGLIYEEDAGNVTIILGEYRIKSIDKVKMMRKDENNIYRVEFRYYPMLVVDIDYKTLPIYKGFANLTYNTFKEKWNSVLELDRDHFDDVYIPVANTVHANMRFHISVTSRDDGKTNQIKMRIGEETTLPDGTFIKLTGFAGEVNSAMPSFNGPAIFGEIKKKGQHEPDKIVLVKKHPDYDSERGGDLILKYLDESWE